MIVNTKTMVIGFTAYSVLGPVSRAVVVKTRDVVGHFFGWFLPPVGNMAFGLGYDA